jgi:transcriptional regulator with XRE-family HTH domain
MIDQKEKNECMREWLTHYMEESGVKLKHVAEELGFSYSNMSSWKNSKREYGFERLNKVNAWLEKMTTPSDAEIVNYTLEVLDAALEKTNEPIIMTISDSNGKRAYKATREEYLEHMLNVALEQLSGHSQAKI